MQLKESDFDEDYMGNIKLNDVIHYALSQFKGGIVHGITHWKNVERNGLQLSEKTEGTNKRVIRLFAYLHDHMRTWDGYDKKHGPCAAEALIDISSTLLSDLSEDEFEMLYRACKIHTSQVEPTGNPTVDCCIDADRLDLPRVGELHQIQKECLRTPEKSWQKKNVMIKIKAYVDGKRKDTWTFCSTKYGCFRYFRINQRNFFYGI